MEVSICRIFWFIVSYAIGVLLSKTIKQILLDKKLHHIKLHIIILAFLFSLYWFELFGNIKYIMPYIVFFFFGAISPVLISGITDCLKSDKKRLETIRSIAIILALPLTVGILKNVSDYNKVIKSNIEQINEKIEQIKQSTAGNEWMYYKNLLSEKQNAKNQEEKNIWEKFIKSFQINAIKAENLVKNIPICKPHINCTQIEPENFSVVDNIFDQRNHKYDVTKAKVAYLFRFTTNEVIKKTQEKRPEIGWEAIMNALIDKIKSEYENLIIRKTALDSFRLLVPEFQIISPIPTIEKPGSVFDFDKAVLFWNLKKSDIISSLKSEVSENEINQEKR